MTQFPPTSQTPIAPDQQQQATDLSHLKTLSIFYWIFAGLSFFGICGGGLYIFLGIAMMSAPADADMDPEAAKAIGGGMIGMGVFVVLLTIVAGLLNAMVASSLRTQRRYMLCMIWAALTCLSIPLGTILGVFTLVVLNRPSVKTMFGR